MLELPHFISIEIAKAEWQMGDDNLIDFSSTWSNCILMWLITEQQNPVHHKESNESLKGVFRRFLKEEFLLDESFEEKRYPVA